MNNPNAKPIVEALKTHYAEKSLSANQLDQLMAMQEAAAVDIPAETEALPESTTTISRECRLKWPLTRWMKLGRI